MRDNKTNFSSKTNEGVGFMEMKTKSSLV